MNTKKLVFTGVFTALITAGAFIRIPLPFLSVTFQMFFALIGGMIIGPSAGCAAAAVYMLLGLSGLPVFASGGGPGYLLQPSFGFILGFIPGAYLSGIIYNNKTLRGPRKILFSYFSGLSAAYLVGILHMYLILRFYLGNGDTTLTATIFSMVPYLIKDIVLGFAVAAGAKYIRRLSDIVSI